MAADPLSYIFGGSTGITYEQLKRRREIAAALASQKRGFPKTVGEGLTYLGESVGDMLADRRLGEMEKQMGAQGAAGMAALQQRPGYEPGAPAAPVAPPAPSAAPPPPIQATPTPAPTRPPPVAPTTRAAPAVSMTTTRPLTPALPEPSASDLFDPSSMTTRAPEMTGSPEFAPGGILNPAPAGVGQMDVYPRDEREPSVSLLRSGALLPPGVAPPSSPPAPSPVAAPTGSPEWQALNEYRASQGRPPLSPPDPAMRRPGYVPPGGGTTEAAPAPAAPGPQSSLDPRYEAGISKLESGHRADAYSLKGPLVRTQGGLHQAIGKYQIMDFNVGPWTEKHLGQRMTPEEFIANPQAQDRVFQAQMSEYAAKYGPENAARAWIGGPGGVNNPGARARDASGRPIGLSVGEYGSQFARGFGQAPPPPGGGATLASYAPGGRTTDAPVPGTGGAGAVRMGPVSAPDEQLTPVDIEPAPPTAQFGPPINRFTRTDAPVPGVPPSGPAGTGVAGSAPAPQQLPGSQPSAEPIPPATEQEFPLPGPPPQRNPPRPMSQRQQEALKIINNPGISPEYKQQAQRVFEIDEGYRKQFEQQDENDYRSKRERWEQQTTAFEKHIREAPERRIKQMGERIGIEKTIQELEKARYEATTPREQARIQADLDIAKRQRELAAPETREIGGQIYQRTPATAAAPAGPWQVAPGSPAKELKIPESEAKTLLALRRSTVAEDQLKNTGGLAKLDDVARGKAPFGAGNYLVSPEYQKVRSAADAWILHTVRHESGAAIKEDEIPQQFKIYFALPGDSEQQIAIKDARRRNATRGLYDSLSGDAKGVADKFFEERKGRRTTQPEGTLQVNPTTGKTRRVIGGHWEYTDAD